MSLVPKIIQPIKKHPFENNMIVIFKKYKKNNKWIYEDGAVNFIDEDKKTANIMWLDNFQSKYTKIPFKDIVAFLDPNIQREVKIGNYFGQFKTLQSNI
jgi:hypothetical protein